MDSRIKKNAQELALKFEADSDIPDRLKSGKLKTSSERISETLVEKRFQKHLDDWIETINSILEHISDPDQAWRFIRIDPKIIDNSISDISQCQDYLDFTNFFIQRRNIDLCGPNELGNLARLHTAFQRKIEAKFNQ
jgi:septation ring formation regulator EzrA